MQDTYTYYFSPSSVTYIWGNFDVVRWKWQHWVFGWAELLFVVPIWIMWALGYIPTIPPVWWQYAGVEYVVFIPIWLVNLLMSDSRSNIAFLFLWFCNGFVFGVTTFLFAILLYDNIACWIGQLPMSCRNTGLADFIVLLFTGVLWIITLIILAATSGVIGRIRQSSTVKGVNFIRQSPAFAPAQQQQQQLQRPYPR